MHVVRNEHGQVLPGNRLRLNADINSPARKSLRIQERYLKRLGSLLDKGGCVESLAERSVECIERPDFDPELRRMVLPLIIPSVLSAAGLGADSDRPEGPSPSELERLAAELGSLEPDRPTLSESEPIDVEPVEPVQPVGLHSAPQSDDADPGLPHLAPVDGAGMGEEPC